MLLHGRNFLEREPQSVHHEDYLGHVDGMELTEFDGSYEENEENDEAKWNHINKLSLR